MTPEQLATGAAFLLFVLFEYVPGFSIWYGNLSQTAKRLGMFVLLALVTVGAFGLSCFELANYYTCDWPGFWQALQVLGLAIAVNQGSHKLLKKPSA